MLKADCLEILGEVEVYCIARVVERTNEVLMLRELDGIVLHIRGYVLWICANPDLPAGSKASVVVGLKCGPIDRSVLGGGFRCYDFRRECNVGQRGSYNLANNFLGRGVCWITFDGHPVEACCEA